MSAINGTDTTCDECGCALALHVMVQTDDNSGPLICPNIRTCGCSARWTRPMDAGPSVDRHVSLRAYLAVQTLMGADGGRLPLTVAEAYSRADGYIDQHAGKWPSPEERRTWDQWREWARDAFES